MKMNSVITDILSLHGNISIQYFHSLFKQNERNFIPSFFILAIAIPYWLIIFYC
jgi:hypothetical protein